MRNKSLLAIGSHVSELSPHDQFVYCMELLFKLDTKAYERFSAKNVSKMLASGAKPSEHLIRRALVGLFTELNKYSPIFTYFGFNPVNPLNLGVWVDLGKLHKAEASGQLTQVYSDDWRGIKSAYILQISPNLTLFRRKGKKEVWSIQ